jgi:hypothetical protein
MELNCYRRWQNEDAGGSTALDHKGMGPKIEVQASTWMLAHALQQGSAKGSVEDWVGG